MFICEKCDIRKYGYTDGIHKIYLCFKCGSFDGMSGGDANFIREITENPTSLLTMIKEKHFKSIN
jgi:hypothetical protein